MYWLDFILPSCCSKKRVNESVVKVSEVQPSIVIEVHNSEENLETYKETETNSYDSDEKLHEFSIIKLIPCFEAQTDISRATTDTSLSMIELSHENFVLKCTTCFKNANGFCVACPQKKYCSDCYKKKHKKELPGHKFFLYKNNS